MSDELEFNIYQDKEFINVIKYKTGGFFIDKQRVSKKYLLELRATRKYVITITDHETGNIITSQFMKPDPIDALFEARIECMDFYGQDHYERIKKDYL